MHEMKRRKIKRRASFWESVILLLIGIFAYLVASNFSDRGIAQKWATAVMATLITFGFVIYAYREIVLRWSFWVSIAICLAVHIVALWGFFLYVLQSVGRFSILFWYPIMLVEVFVLLVAVKRLEEKLTGKHEITRLRF
jgi:hypothetical protein